MKTYAPESAEIAELKREVEELKAKILSLRSSRRILMDLLAIQTQNMAQQVKHLEWENRQLKQQRHMAPIVSVIPTPDAKDPSRRRH